MSQLRKCEEQLKETQDINTRLCEMVSNSSEQSKHAETEYLEATNSLRHDLRNALDTIEYLE